MARKVTLQGDSIELAMEWVCRFLGVSRPTLYRYLADGKLKSLDAKDIGDFARAQIAEEIEAALDKEYKRKYSQLLVNDSSPSPAPIPGTSPDTSQHTSQDTSPTPSLKEENVSSSSSPAWAKVQAPWTDADLEEVPVSSSPNSTKHWLDEVADQVEGVSSKKKYFR
jgi:predicted DNA-binding transcriptional regulator AlpA